MSMQEMLTYLASWAVIGALICFFVARHRGRKPWVALLVGFGLGFIPVAWLIYLIWLIFQPVEPAGKAPPR
ncbi:hypothetical protein A11A3_14982 [Alcanivorax hongdengensis A-11-3]|uniref:Cardiolipin synthase N-terminal domain-containing protein n=1 Tax=Alcanivorax hongdengensis A-11-3 TaxID=1177179 RepID=L0WAR8_9GAMM|nr:hypothetical protein [Alcanivorax hongdengensis]EKF73187.1 hypothetical protein A11A3_14982 [Alcanivorax hongdengensis A-11-3]